MGSDSHVAVTRGGGNFYQMGLLRPATTRSHQVRAPRGAILAVATVLLLTGCGTTTVSGHATSSSSNSSSTTSTAASARPDPGNYPITPRPSLGPANTALGGSLLDAQRMAGFVVGPWEVDPRLIDTYPVGPMVLKSAAAIGPVVDQTFMEAAERHGFVNGFRSARKADGHTILVNTVLRFPDQASAAAAAAEMNQAKIERPVSGATRSVVSINGHPDALASNYPFTPQDTKVEWRANMTSLTPHGPFVLMQEVQSTDSLDAGLALTAKTLDLQIPLIDQFAPTAPADFPTLPKDPTGQLARTLPVPEKEVPVVSNATYDRRGELHFQSDPVATGQLFDATGVDVVTAGRSNVFRAADAAAAAKIVDVFAQQVGAIAGAVPSAPVVGVPGSRCLTVPSVGAYCVAAADRYAFEVSAAQLGDAAQLLAAQYLMLTAS
jgi:hypothetical protein